jgi:hypothetical protein
MFPVTAEEDEYACDCGNTISAGSALALAKMAQYGQMWKLELGVNVVDPAKRNETQRRILSMIQSVRGSKVDDERPGYILASINGDEDEVMRLVSSLKPLGANLVSDPQRVAELLREAQVGQPSPMRPPVAPPVAPSVEEEAPVSEMGMDSVGLEDIGGGDLPSMADIPDNVPALTEMGGMTLEKIQAYFMTYMDEADAGTIDADKVVKLVSDIARNKLGIPKGSNLPPEVNAWIMAAGSSHFSSGKMAAVKTAEGGMKVPSVKKDHKAPNASPTKMEKDTEQEELPIPFKRIKPTHSPSSQSGTALPAKKLEDDSELDDTLPVPGGEPSVTHSPTSQRGTSLPNKKLDSNSELNSGFAVPAPKAVPGTGKK